MKSTRKRQRAVGAEAIARRADAGKDVSALFTNTGHMMAPREPQSPQRVNVDFAATMLEELDEAAKQLNISRQAVIKTLVRQALDHHYAATAGRSAARRS